MFDFDVKVETSTGTNGTRASARYPEVFRRRRISSARRLARSAARCAATTMTSRAAGFSTTDVRASAT